MAGGRLAKLRDKMAAVCEKIYRGHLNFRWCPKVVEESDLANPPFGGRGYYTRQDGSKEKVEYLLMTGILKKQFRKEGWDYNEDVVAVLPDGTVIELFTKPQRDAFFQNVRKVTDSCFDSSVATFSMSKFDINELLSGQNLSLVDPSKMVSIFLFSK